MLGLRRERAGDADALRLPAGELVRVAVEEVRREAHGVDQLARAARRALPGRGRAGGSAAPPAIARMVLRGLSEETGSWKTYWTLPRQRAGLRAGAGRGRRRRGGWCRRSAVEADQHARQRRLAAAGFADDAQRLARAPGEVDALAPRAPPGAAAEQRAAAAEGARQAAHLDQRAHVGLSRSAPAGRGSAPRAPARQRPQRDRRRAGSPSGPAGSGRRRRSPAAGRSTGGGRPGSRRAGAPARPSTGTQAISARCRDAPARRARPRSAPVSTIRPAYITATRSQSCGDDAEIVGDEEHGGAAARGAARPAAEDLRLHGDVERRGRLVGDEDVRVVGERHGDADALAHAAGELVRIGRRAGRRRRGCAPVQQLRRPAPGRGAADDRLVRAHRLGDLVADGEQRVQRGQRILEDVGDPAAAQAADALVRQRRAGPRPRSRRAPPAMTPGGEATRPMSDSAVTDLPEPDSPTRPRHSPGAERRDRRRRRRADVARRPRTRCCSADVERRVGRARARQAASRRAIAGARPSGRVSAPERRRGSSTSRMPSPSRLMLITSDEDHQARDDRDVRRGEQQLAALAQHGAEIGLRRLRAEAEEGEAGGLQDHPADGGRHGDDDDRQHVGQHLGRTGSRTWPLPDSRAASTNSRRARPSVMPRMLRAKNGMLTMAMA